jgi:hypothetical protein
VVGMERYTNLHDVTVMITTKKWRPHEIWSFFFL